MIITRAILAFMLLSLSVIGFVDFRDRLNEHALASATEPLTAVALPLAERLATSNDPAAWLKIGHQLLWSNEPELAALIFDRATTLAPSSPEAHLYLGWALLRVLEQGRQTSTEAEATLTRARTAIATAQKLDPANTLARKLAEALP